MKVKAFSWILAAMYLLCGLFFVIVVPGFQAVFAEMEVDLPALTRAVFFVGSIGWLAFAALGCAVTVLKDMKFHSPWLNPLLTIVLALLVSGMAVAMFLPVCETPFSRLGPPSTEPAAGDNWLPPFQFDALYEI